METFTEVTLTPKTTVPTTVRMHTAGIIIPLKIALPAVVPIPIAKAFSLAPVVPETNSNANRVVHNSGSELEIALIVPPRTPSERLRPMYSEAISNPSQALQMNKQQKKIKINAIKVPTSFCPFRCLLPPSSSDLRPN